ncbi:MAG: hypothetical protein ACYC27_03920 [Armatimonadota bacterium]
MKTMLVSIIMVGVLSAICSPASAWKQKDFMITFWCPPPANEENMAILSRDHYNLTGVGIEGDRISGNNNLVEQLDIVKKHGLRALVFSPLLNPASLDNPDTKVKLDALINAVKSHPALEGYHLTDEPGSGAFPGLGRLTEYIKARDPKHLIYINLFPTYANEQQLGVSADEAERQKVGIPLNFAGVGDYKRTILAYNEHLRQYVKIVKPELISYDHYHFLKNGVDGAQYFLNLGLIREASISANLPFLNIIQASTIEPSWRLVNKNELRWLVYTTLAYGGKGISYFLYWGPTAYGGLYQDGKRTPLADDVADINRSLKVIGKEMMKLKSEAVYHTGSIPVGGTPIPVDSPVKIVDGGEYVLGLFTKESKSDSFMIVNRNYKKSSIARIELPDNVFTLKEFNRNTGRWNDITRIIENDAANIKLEPGDGRLFRMILR